MEKTKRVVTDEEDRRNPTCRIKWDDGLGDDRTPVQYHMQLYPMGHVELTLEATNDKLDIYGYPPLTLQEFFQLQGLMVVMSFYPKFTVRELFCTTAEVRRSKWVRLPNLSKYMRYNRLVILLKHITWWKPPSRAYQDTCSFWKVQPLVDAYNVRRKKYIVPGQKMVVDESMSEWRGKDQRWGAKGCPHVTKIARKPKSTGMEVKDLADCTSGIMMAIELVACKDEMHTREYHAQYGSGTSLLLRLCKNWKGTGRVIVADSAFASVKSAIALRKEVGLYFLGLVKTAHRHFPKKYLQKIPITERGGHVVCITSKDDVNLRDVGWNDGKKDKKTDTIIRKKIIGSCGTTFDGIAHKKRHPDTDTLTP